jgi:DNA repair exonuclease SbcCD ATPase subunit
LIKIRRRIPEAWYCGSLIQQNHGEANDKGVLIWEIRDKDNFTVRPFHFENPKPFISIPVDENGNLPEMDVPKHSRLRLVLDHPLTLKQLQDAKEEARWRYEPISLVHIDNSKLSALTEAESIHYSQENLRDLKVQNELIYAHFKGRQIDADLLDRILEINKEVEEKVQYSDEVYRNIKWTIEKFKWSNLFNYGNDNEIDFRVLNGLIGIFGRSYTGKSSIIDAIMYTIFNKTAKGPQKLARLINDKKNSAESEIWINAGGKPFYIERKAKKKNKGLDASGNVNFSSGKENLNGQNRNETDKNIRKIFGSVDDFLLTSMIPQFDARAFIKEGSTKRKEVLAKFLDLEIFENKFKIAKEMTDALKGAIKLDKKINFDEKIKEAQQKQQGFAERVQQARSSLEDVTLEWEKIKKEKTELEADLPDFPINLKNVRLGNLSDDIELTLRNINEYIQAYGTRQNMIDDLVGKIDLLKEEIDQYVGIDLIREFIKIADAQEQKYERLYFIAYRSVHQCEKDIELLCQVPCGDFFPKCKFITKAHSSKKIYEEEQTKETKYEKRRDFYKNIMNNLLKLVAEYAEKEILLSQNNSTILRLRQQQDKIQDKIEQQKRDLNLLKARENEYFKHKEEIKLRKQVDALSLQEDKLRKAVNIEKLALESLLMQSGKVDGELGYLIEQQKVFNKRMEEYEAYELYLKCMHSNGVPYDIIKQKLPVLNMEIAKILDGIFDFTIKFEADEKKLNIYICHQDQHPRLVSVGSGAEQTIAAIVITLALRMLTTLPQSDIFILDEPIGALHDELKMDFVNLLNYIKSQFIIVFLITHLESLKDVVDKELNIEHINGYARMKES